MALRLVAKVGKPQWNARREGPWPLVGRLRCVHQPYCIHMRSHPTKNKGATSGCFTSYAGRRKEVHNAGNAITTTPRHSPSILQMTSSNKWHPLHSWKELPVALLICSVVENIRISTCGGYMECKSVRVRVIYLTVFISIFLLSLLWRGSSTLNSRSKGYFWFDMFKKSTFNNITKWVKLSYIKVNLNWEQMQDCVKATSCTTSNSWHIDNPQAKKDFLDAHLTFSCSNFQCQKDRRYTILKKSSCVCCVNSKDEPKSGWPRLTE